MKRTRTLIESPFARNERYRRRTNRIYLRACLRDSISRGEAPFASHGLYPQVLSDYIPEERELGLSLGDAWAEEAEIIAFYIDLGMTPGMIYRLKQIFDDINTKGYRPKATLEIRSIPDWEISTEKGIAG